MLNSFDLAQLSTNVPDIVSAVIISLTTALLFWLFRSRVTIIFGSTTWSLHSINTDNEQPCLLVSSEKIYVQNMGKIGANDIELVLSTKPFSYKLWSPRDHSEKELRGGQHSITIPSLAPKELLIVDILSTGQRAELVNVNCPQCIPKNVPFLPQRQFGAWLNVLVIYLMLAGAIGSVYLVLRLL